jgi:hypothetical protein
MASSIDRTGGSSSISTTAAWRARWSASALSAAMTANGLAEEDRLRLRPAAARP